MIVVTVNYSTKPEYAERNISNIKSVMKDLLQAAHSGIAYHVCLGEDGRSFTHTAFFKSPADRQLLNELPSFIQFQQELKSGGLENPPRQESPVLVGSTNETWNSWVS